MPHLATAVGGIYVSAHATSSVLVTMFVEEEFTRAGIAKVGTVGTGFMHHIELKSWTVGVKVGEMEGIAMSETSGIQKSSVIVNCSRTVGNLVASVAIHVSHGYSVGTLSVCRSLQSFGGFQYFSIGIMKIPFLRTYGGVQPLGGELLTVEIHSPQIRACVISAAHHRTRIPGDTVEMSHACEIPLATVALTF